MLCAISLNFADACDGINCEFGGECVDGECVCRHNCSLIDDPVCANNDVTYPNECTLLKAGCHQMISLEVLHAGSCSEMSGSGGTIDCCHKKILLISYFNFR